jgi:hypothetical protein
MTEAGAHGAARVFGAAVSAGSSSAAGCDGVGVSAGAVATVLTGALVFGTGPPPPAPPLSGFSTTGGGTGLTGVPEPGPGSGS